MAAWKHVRYWTDELYEIGYRNYVRDNAAQYEGDTRDCADLSVTLLIEFAAAMGLPLTFYDNAGVRYISKAERQSPSGLRTRSWKDKEEYMVAVRKRIGSSNLLPQNMEPNPIGPQPGDLMINPDHTALVFRVWPPGAPHPLAYQDRIPLFPGREEAAKQLNQTKYFRDDPFGPVQSQGQHIDYLNHRGVGTPKKEKAELILFADVGEVRKEFQFRRYLKRVLCNWERWDGRGDAPLFQGGSLKGMIR